MLRYNKLIELPEYLSQNQIDTPLKEGMKEEEIIALLSKMELSNEMTDLSGIKLDERDCGHNFIYEDLILNGHTLHIVSEATYEEYDPEFDTWQYVYTRPVGWFL
ncbi:hypothetical protein [uncultured Faecalicoccus sp.]|uniref:hypothetical protein n=1 Tax=uncultured Faecalicoccus sp. TaxID=1971760 RepID=UPI00261DC033|nr:hypothetical protein [uncultured Faecalicoccus sp.]